MGHWIELSEENAWEGRKAVVALVISHLATRCDGYPVLTQMLGAEEREVQKAVGHWSFAKLSLSDVLHVRAVVQELRGSLAAQTATWNQEYMPVVRDELADLDARLAAHAEQLRQGIGPT